MLRPSRLARRLISFVTDVEGNNEYFQRWLRQSEVVGLSACGSRLILKGGDDSHFVFGGDCFDKGTDLPFAESLIQLKRDYPDRVHLLLGNRDVNKMVFASEFADREAIESMPPDQAHQHVFPVESPMQKTAVTYAQYLEKHGLPAVTSMATLLQWTLAHRMGSAEAFESRRSVLAERQRVAAAAVTDEDVVDSFLGSVKPGGIVYEYLRHADMACLLGSFLFVHGSLRSESIGFVPDPFSARQAAQQVGRLPGRDFVAEGRPLGEWVDALNRDFCRRGFSEWAANPCHVPGTDRTGGEYVRSYAFRYTPLPYSAMINNFLDGKQLAHAIEPRVGEYLQTNGIHAVCCGHQPCGDTPTVLAQPGYGVRIIMADNSYCATDNSRGEAVSEVLLDTDNHSIRLHGTRASGEPYDMHMRCTGAEMPSSTSPDSLIGYRLSSDGWWSKLVTSRGTILCQRTNDAFFHIDYKELAPSEVAQAISEARAGGSSSM